MASATAPGLVPSNLPGPLPSPPSRNGSGNGSRNGSGNGSGDGASPPTIAARTTREVGRVHWFSADRGFGWVRADDGTDVFMSFRDLPGAGFRSVAADDRVSFVRDHDRHGTVARAVTVLARGQHEDRPEAC